MFKRIILALLGINLMSLGLNVILDINWGVGPFDSMTLLLQQLFKINNFSNASLSLHLIFAVVLLFLIKRFNIKIRDLIISCLSIFLITRFVGLYDILINIQSTNVVIFCIAFLVLNLGLYFISISNLLIAPYDKFIVELSQYKKLDLGIVRLIGDGSLLLIVVILNLVGLTNVVISFGTIFITIGTGLNISLYKKMFNKEIND